MSPTMPAYLPCLQDTFIILTLCLYSLSDGYVYFVVGRILFLLFSAVELESLKSISHIPRRNLIVKILENEYTRHTGQVCKSELN
jgi:hypothetical protein